MFPSSGGAGGDEQEALAGVWISGVSASLPRLQTDSLQEHAQHFWRDASGRPLWIFFCFVNLWPKHFATGRPL